MRHLLLFFSVIAGLTAQTFNISVVSGGGQTAVTGTEFGQPITVKLTTGNLLQLPAAGIPVTFTLPTTSLSGPAAGAFFNFFGLTVTATTNAQGLVTVGPLAANNTIGSYIASVKAGSSTATFGLTNAAYQTPSVAPESLSFEMNLGDAAPAGQTVTISSPTDGYTASVDMAFVKLTLRSNSVLIVNVDPTGLAAGRFQANITINGNVVIPVSLNIFAKSQLFGVLPDGSLNFTYVQFTPRASSRPLNQFVTVWSSRSNFPVVVDQTYVSPVNGKWLAAASKKGTVTPVNLEVVVDPTGLAPGTYQANLRIAAATAANSPLLIPVTLTVRRFPNARQPEINSVANGASLVDGAVSSGALASISTSNLSCTSDPVVTVDGTPAQIIGSKAGRMSLVVPDVTGRSRSQVRVACDDQISEAYDVPVAAAAPGIFTNDDGTALAVNTTLFGRRAVRLYGTGFGAMTDDGAGKQIPVMPLRVWMGGVLGRVISVAPAADLPGVMEMVVLVPETVDPGSTVSLEVLFDAAAAQPGLKIAVN